MQQFTVRPGSFKEVQGKIIKIVAFLFGGILFFVVGLPVLISDDPSNVGTLPYMIVLFGGASVFGLWRSMKRQKALFESFKLIIDDEKITRERLNTPVIVIYKKDVKQIIKASAGTFCIEGDSKLNAIVIPSQIENYDQLQQTLNEIKPLTVYTKKNFIEKMFIPIVLSIAALFVGHFYVSNKVVSVISGIVLVLVLGASFYVSVTNKNIDKRTKMVSYFSLLVLALVVFNLYSKIIG